MAKRLRTELKKLESMKSEILVKIKGIKQQKSNVDRELSAATTNLKEIEKKIEKIQLEERIIVSEHAILRYIERVIGINIEEISRKIVSEELEQTIMSLGNGVYTVNQNEFRIKVKENVVVTVEV